MPTRSARSPRIRAEIRRLLDDPAVLRVALTVWDGRPATGPLEVLALGFDHGGKVDRYPLLTHQATPPLIFVLEVRSQGTPRSLRLERALAVIPDLLRRLYAPRWSSSSEIPTSLQVTDGRSPSPDSATPHQARKRSRSSSET